MIIKVRSASYHLDKMCFCSILLRHYYHYVLRLETFKARLYSEFIYIRRKKEDFSSVCSYSFKEVMAPRK